jgi:hypothetical protein
MKPRTIWLLTLLASGMVACVPAFAQNAPGTQTQAPQGVPLPVLVVDAGPCTAEFIIRDASGKGLYDAKITMQAEYGFLGLRKLDLNVGTNYQGEARVEGLPEKVRRPADFKITHGGREKIVPYDPVAHCYAQHNIILGDTSTSQAR